MVNGRVSTFGSAVVTVSSIVLESANAKRSTMLIALLWNVPVASSQSQSLMFSVSTTSVFPSQWPRASPIDSLTLEGRCGRFASSGMTRNAWLHSHTITTCPGDWTIWKSPY